jgi:hypothetical protein
MSAPREPLQGIYADRTHFAWAPGAGRLRTPLVDGVDGAGRQRQCVVN